MYYRIGMGPGLVVVWSLLLTVVLSEGKTLEGRVVSVLIRYVHVELKGSQV